MSNQGPFPSTFIPIHFTADQLIKTGAGMVHTITLSSDAAATAGTLILYDSVTEANTVILKVTFEAAYLRPVNITLDARFDAGLYAGLTTTGDVDITVTYR